MAATRRKSSSVARAPRQHESPDNVSVQQQSDVEPASTTPALATSGGSTAGASTTKDDENNLLIHLCVRVLEDIHPRGMTTKELSAALDTTRAQHPSFPGISSSILSSKLNSFFRRYHSDSNSPSLAQLSQLPLTRQVSKDGPRRLVYQWVQGTDYRWSPTEHPAELEATEAEASEPEASEPSESTELNELIEPAQSESNEPTESNEPSEPAQEFPTDSSIVSPAEVHDDLDQLTPEQSVAPIKTPLSPVQSPPKASFVPAGTPASHVKHTLPVTPPAEVDEPPVKRRFIERSTAASSANKVNLYYDAIDLQLSPTLPVTAAPALPKWGSELTAEFDFESPEALSPDDLEGLVF